MIILRTNGWEDYSLWDSGNGRRLEQFGEYTLSRPDPQCLWQPHLPLSAWEKADAVFREKEGWVLKGKTQDKWKMSWRDIKFYAKLSPFKHTGIFPEQTLHWE